MKFLDWLLVRQEFKENTRACKTCSVLRLELDRAHVKNDKLLEQILAKPVQPEVGKENLINRLIEPREFKPVPTSIKHWEQTRAILEAKDAEEFARKNAIKKQEEIDKLAKASTTEQLEEALEIKNA